VMHMATDALMASAFCAELAESGCSTMMVPALLAATWGSNSYVSAGCVR
jgi:hypothetical protein